MWFKTRTISCFIFEIFKIYFRIFEGRNYSQSSFEEIYFVVDNVMSFNGIKITLETSVCEILIKYKAIKPQN